MAFSFSELGKNLTQQLTKGVSGPTGNTQLGIASLLQSDDAKNLWTITGSNWYQVYGYQFEVSVSGGESKYFTLPIPPQAVSITPIFPSKITPTMGGITEEHSAVALWQISLSGTTGIAISRKEGDEVSRKYMAGQFRDVLSTTGLLAGKFNTINKAINRIGGLVDNTISTIEGVTAAKNPLDAITNATGGVVGAVNNTLLPALPYSSSSVSKVTNGFTEAQELKKFFYVYQKLKADDPKKFNLYFSLYKTNQKWRVSINNFSLQQAAGEPMLYKYNISLTGWDCKGTDNQEGLDKPFDRFGPQGDLKSVNTMGFSSKANAQALSKIGRKIKF